MSTRIEPRRMAVILSALTGLSVGACAGEEPAPEAGPSGEPQAQGHVVHWGYEADDGPGAWASMNPDWAVCAEGLEQSPIDLTAPGAIELPPTELKLPSDAEVDLLNQSGVVDELDNGHTVQINARTGENLTVGDRTYLAVQFHFHAPSEHTVDGEHYPMEMHFVHQADDGALAVVGVFIKEGAHNQGVALLWEHLTNDRGTATTLRIPYGFGDELITGEPSGVYHYSGSLTTPPCSQDVSWYVRRTPTELSAEQIAAFAAVYDHNNRPVQELNERTLYLDENLIVAIR